MKLSLSRRGFFGAAAAAPLAGAGIARQLADPALLAPSRTLDIDGEFGNALGGQTGGSIWKTKAVEHSKWLTAEVERLKTRLLRLGDNAPPLAQRMLWVERIDPDLVASRSLPASARIRIQAERNWQRALESDRLSIQSSIANYTKQLLGEG